MLNPENSNDVTRNPPSFLSQKPHHSLTPKDLKYATPKDLEEKRFKLSPEEEEIKRLLEFKQNKADILNENYKLKETLRYLVSHYDSLIRNKDLKIDDLEHQIEKLKHKIDGQNGNIN